MLRPLLRILVDADCAILAASGRCFSLAYFKMFDNLVQVFRKTFKIKTKDVTANGKQNGQCSDPEQEDFDSAENGMKLTDKEFKAAIIALSFSLTVLCGKLIFGNKDALHSVYDKRKDLLNPKFVSSIPMWLEGLSSIMENTWFDLRWILIPLCWSIFLTFYAWFMIYKNIRHIPGVDAPSPSTPSRYKHVNGHTFYLDYLLPLAVSSCGFLLMLYLSHLAA